MWSESLALGEVGSRVNVYKTITVMITADKSRAVKPVMSDMSEILVMTFYSPWSKVVPTMVLHGKYTIFNIWLYHTTKVLLGYHIPLHGSLLSRPSWPGQLRRASVGPK